MLKKASRNKDAVPDVSADNPVGTMERFTNGLRRVLSTSKAKRKLKQKERTRRPHG